MKRFLLAALAIMFVCATVNLVRADDTDPSAVLDKAIKAMGGEEKLKKIDAVTWKSKVAITFNENTSQFTSHSTLQGLDHYRSEFEGEFGGNPFKGVTVLNGDKGCANSGTIRWIWTETLSQREAPDLPSGDPRPAPTLEGEGIQNRVSPRGKGRRQAGRRHQGDSARRQGISLSISTKKAACP